MYLNRKYCRARLTVIHCVDCGHLATQNLHAESGHGITDIATLRSAIAISNTAHGLTQL